MSRAVRTFIHQFRLAAQIFVGVLHEIFDEAAYSRFLTRKHTTSSRESYSEFRRENELAKARRPRCC